MLKFGVADEIRDPCHHALEIIDVNGFTIQPTKIEMAADDGKGISEFFRSVGLGQNLFCFSKQREQTVEGGRRIVVHESRAARPPNTPPESLR